MTRLASRFVKFGSVAALALGSITLTSAGFAATPSSAASELRSQADHHAMMAAEYRARMRSDEKHAISWFTQANHCDQKAQRLRVAALAAEATLEHAS